MKICEMFTLDDHISHIATCHQHRSGSSECGGSWMNVTKEPLFRRRSWLQ